MRKSKSRPLTREDWIEAALGAIARGGIDAVAVEPIAAELGATKGSFYWHFTNRDALMEAALDEWERRGTDAVLEDLQREVTPAARFQKIFAWTSDMPAEQRAIEIALLANPTHRLALRAVRRVAQRRIAYTVEQLQSLGWDATFALDRALLMYYLYVGYLLTAHVMPGVVQRDEEYRQRYERLIFETIAAAEPPATTEAGPTSRRRKPRSQ